MDYSSLGTVTGACHAPVAGRQGNAEDWEVNGDSPPAFSFEMGFVKDFFCK